MDDFEFLNSLGEGGWWSHTRSYPLLIQFITHLLLTNVLQNEAHFEMLPVWIGSEPAGSKWDCGSQSSISDGPTYKGMQTLPREYCSKMQQVMNL